MPQQGVKPSESATTSPPPSIKNMTPNSPKSSKDSLSTPITSSLPSQELHQLQPIHPISAAKNVGKKKENLDPSKTSKTSIAQTFPIPIFPIQNNSEKDQDTSSAYSAKILSYKNEKIATPSKIPQKEHDSIYSFPMSTIPSPADSVPKSQTKPNDSSPSPSASSQKSITISSSQDTQITSKDGQTISTNGTSPYNEPSPLSIGSSSSDSQKNASSASKDSPTHSPYDSPST